MTSTSAPAPGPRPVRPSVVLLALAALLAVAGSLALDLATTSAQRRTSGLGLAIGTSPQGAVLLLAAAVVLHHRPAHPVGRVLATLGAVWALDGVLSGWGTWALVHGAPGVDLAFWFVWRFGAVLITGLVVLLLLYPDGTLLRGRWRAVSIVVLVAAATLPLALLVAPESLVEVDVPGVDTGALALPMSDGTAFAVLTTTRLLTFSSVIAAVALVWVRHRQSDAEDRTRLRWLSWAGIMCVLTFVVGLTLGVGGAFTTVLLGVAIVVLAASVTIGIVRPDLADVDSLVAWTATSAAVAAVVVAFDLAVLFLATSVLGDRLDERRITVLVLLLAVVAYGPLRSWLGGWVRRVLFGRRSERYSAVSSLAAELEAAPTVAEQVPALAAAVARTFKLPFVRVELITPDGGLLAATHGEPSAEVQAHEIAYRGTRVGRLVLPAVGVRSMLSRRDHALLLDLVRQAAIAVRADLLATELQESRERLVLGREEDRRRIRRDLHDGLGPALGGVALRLQAAGNAMGPDPERARELVGLAREEVREALDDVRRLVHGLRPPALDDLGLEAALRQQAERVRPEVDVSVTAQDVEGLPAAVEVAAYRIVSEALTNVVRHAGATRCSIDLVGQDGALRVRVVDDGRGIGEDVVAGVGLHALRERAEELGGYTEVSCPPAGGTMVEAWLPHATTPTTERTTG